MAPTPASTAPVPDPPAHLSAQMEDLVIGLVARALGISTGIAALLTSALFLF